MVFIVWSRMTGVLLNYRKIGTVIRTIFTMCRILFKYIFIIIFFMACCTGIFTCLFNRHSEQFRDFSTSKISLFGAFLNDFNCYGFDGNYQAAGSVILLIYVCFASVLFINLLIVIISHGFQEINKVVESSHIAELINYCKKYKWDIISKEINISEEELPKIDDNKKYNSTDQEPEENIIKKLNKKFKK